MHGLKTFSCIFFFFRSLLTYKNVERGHSGCWKVIAKNSVGEDEHEIRVDVVSPPTRPSGAVEVSKATPTGCLVSFKKPKVCGKSHANIA